MTLARLTGIGPPIAVRGYCFNAFGKGEGVPSGVEEVLTTDRGPRSPLLKMKISLSPGSGDISFLAYDTSEAIRVPQFTRALSLYFKNKGFTKKLMPMVVAISEREGIGGPIETFNITTGEVEKTLHINNRILVTWITFFEMLEQSEDKRSISWLSFTDHLREKNVRIFNESWLRFALSSHPDIFIWKGKICLVQRGENNKETIELAIDRFGVKYVQDTLSDMLDGEIDFDVSPALPISEIMKVTGLEELTVRHIVRKEKDFMVVGDGIYSFRRLYPWRFTEYKAPVKNPSSRPSKAWRGVYFVLKRLRKGEKITKKEVHQRMLRVGFYWIYSAVSGLIDTPPYPSIICKERRVPLRGKEGVPIYSLDQDILASLKQKRKK